MFGKFFELAGWMAVGMGGALLCRVAFLNRFDAEGGVPLK